MLNLADDSVFLVQSKDEASSDLQSTLSEITTWYSTRIS
jgi:hypothetical protein